MSTPGHDRPTRQQRRQRTEAAILAAARASFAAKGFQGTTIRAVARTADVDPALVMQYFGSKEALFAAAAHSTVRRESVAEATREELAGAALAHVLEDFEDPEHGETLAALVRSCLTHPAAQQVMLEGMMQTQAAVARTIGGEDAALRAALLNACTLGLTVARYLLRTPALAEASHEEIGRLLEPALRAIVESRR